MRTLIYVLFSFILLSCNEDDLNPEKRETFEKVVFKFDITTRATDTRFEEGDEIGVYVVRRGSSLLQSGNYADNKRFIVRNGQLVPYSESDGIVIRPEETYDYYAYSPYNTTCIPNLFLQSIDQSNLQNYKNGDLKYAISRNVRDFTVYLSFRHAFSLLEVHLNKQSELQINELEVFNCYYGADFDLSNGNTITNTNYRGNVQMNLYNKNGNEYVFRAILPAQSFLAGATVFRLKYGNNSSMLYKNKDDLQLRPGEKVVYDLREKFSVVAYSLKDSCIVSYPEQYYHWCGDYVTVRAFPGENYDFAGWYEKGIYFVSNEIVYTFPVHKSWSLAAQFTLKREKLQIIETTDDGGVGGYTEGAYDSVTRFQSWMVVANPYFEEGYNFNGWYENGKLLTTNRSYEFNMPAHSLILEAKFVRTRYRLSLKISGNGKAVFLSPGGGWTESSSIAWEKNTVCTVEARYSSASVSFLGWYENGVRISIQKQYTFTVTGPRNIEARFQ